MSTQNQDGTISILAGQASTAQYRLVKSDGTYQDGASATRTHIGVTQEPQATTAKPVTVKTGAGDRKLTAEEAITAGDVLYYGAVGKVGKTAASNTKVGIAVTAASGDGGIFEAVLF